MGVYPESASIDGLFEVDADLGVLIVVGREGLSVLDVRPHFSLQRRVNFDLFYPIGVGTAALDDHCCP